MRLHFYIHSAVIGILSLFISACGTAPDEIQKSLKVKKVAKFKYEEVSDKIRFNDTFSVDAVPNNVASNEHLKFDFQLPSGWVELPKSQFKDLHFSITAEPKIHCYLTILPLKGGEILSNLNRWRGQFSLPPIDDITKQEFEVISFLGKETKLFKLSGDFNPLDENGKEYISLSLMHSDEKHAYSFKFLGPSEIILKEKENLLKLLNSLKISNTNIEEKTSKKLPIIPSTILWDTPEGWALTDPKPQRIATFKPSNSDAPECYIAAFGGGILENINRWRAQMNLLSIDNLEKQELENFDSPIGAGVVVFLEGAYSGGMSGKPIESAIMAGAIILGSNKTVFVKMVGTKEEVLKEKESFLKLIKSLKGGEDVK